MFPRARCRRFVNGALALIAAAAAPAIAAPTPSGADATACAELVAAVTIDDIPVDEPVALHAQGATLLIAAEDLRRLGVPTTATGPVALAAVPGLEWRFDAATQALTLRTRRAGRRTMLSAARPAVAMPVTRSDWGAIVTYDATLARAPRDSAAAALIDASFFTPAGPGFATVLAAAGGNGRRPHVDRLVTGYTLTDPDHLRRATLGDFIPAATSWSRPVRMAGVQFGTDFSLRPDLVTFGMPPIAGSAAVPSAVDVVVNGTRIALGDVRAGQFAVADVPVQAGLNTVSVAMRDALGRETLQSVSLYTSRALLRPGLADVSVELGVVRVGYGGTHDHYGTPAWSGSLRRGLSDRLTMEAHGEGSARATALGAGLTWGMGVVGQLDVSMAASAGHGPAAAQLAIGYERIARHIHLAARYTRSDGGFRDLAAQYGTANRTRSLLLNIGFDLGRLGTASGGIVALGRGHRLATPSFGASSIMLPGAAAATPLRASTLATGGWSLRLAERWSVVANGGAELRRHRGGYASLGLLASFGPRTSVAATTTARGGGGTGAVEAVRTALLPGDWGWRASVARGGIDRIAGGAEYQGTAGHVEVLTERLNGRTALRLSARGGLVATTTGITAADTRTGSVAMVDTGGAPGITVYRDNQAVGTTDAHGRLVVANLNPFQVTKLSIDPLQLSDEVAVDAADLVLRPGERTGVAARFALHRMAGLVVQLMDADWQPLPAGARARGPGGLDLPIGEDGTLFVATAQPDMMFVVQLSRNTRCLAHLRASRLAGPVTRLGPVRCVMVNGGAS